ncbi:MAG: aminotransferase class I/II-fold pyridoxal phosphate-dependent enzyme, partial [Pyrinomonadaceae bacterium]|nr:aminotransferase class I/II-fold pyridoxal phosphate-dependent enzyme [Pyrinomonadaceae bacterium]
MYSNIKNQLQNTINEIKSAGLYKSERVIESPQDAHIKVASGEVLNMCANNYLGLSDDKSIIEAAHKALDDWGYGLSSVRFICGTQSIHKELEQKISEFLGMEDTILYTSCFDANGGLFETILSEEDAIISDELNHASIIDGIRLCKAQRFRYKNGDMNDLEEKLKETS